MQALGPFAGGTGTRSTHHTGLVVHLPAHRGMGSVEAPIGQGDPPAGTACRYQPGSGAQPQSEKGLGSGHGVGTGGAQAEAGPIPFGCDGIEHAEPTMPPQAPTMAFGGGSVQPAAPAPVQSAPLDPIAVEDFKGPVGLSRPGRGEEEEGFDLSRLLSGQPVELAAVGQGREGAYPMALRPPIEVAFAGTAAPLRYQDERDHCTDG
jgi:hypothetical protein